MRHKVYKFRRAKNGDLMFQLLNNDGKVFNYLRIVRSGQMTTLGAPEYNVIEFIRLNDGTFGYDHNRKWYGSHVDCVNFLINVAIAYE